MIYNPIINAYQKANLESFSVTYILAYTDYHILFWIACGHLFIHLRAVMVMEMCHDIFFWEEIVSW